MPKVVNVNLQPTTYQNSIWASYTDSSSATTIYILRANQTIYAKIHW